MQKSCQKLLASAAFGKRRQLPKGNKFLWLIKKAGELVAYKGYKVILGCYVLKLFRHLEMGSFL